MKKFDDAFARNCRLQFPSLLREQDGQPVVFLDGPAGTQVPRSVADAVGNYLLHYNANHAGKFSTSIETDEMLEKAFRAMADFVGADDPKEIMFGPNMTTLTFALSRAMAREWKAGDEVIVTAIDHDANITPWVLAARDAGATVHMVNFRSEDYLVDLEHLGSLLWKRTRLVAVCCASNATGGVNPVAEITKMAHTVGAETFLDAVHYSPHGLVDVQAWDCDWLALSTYKFFGPHLGAIWGRGDRLKEIQPYKVRPSSNEIPWRWMTGTQSHEAIAGALACVDYMAEIGRGVAEDKRLGRRQALKVAAQAIGQYESQLVWKLIAGLQEIDGVTIYGITDPKRANDRFATVSFTMDGVPTSRLARMLADEGIFVWGGNYYALEFTTRMGLEPEGMIRVGLVHYNLTGEVDRLLDALMRIRETASAGATA